MMTRLFHSLHNICLLAIALTFLSAPIRASAQTDDRKMLTYMSSIEVAAPPQKVWDSFKDFDRIHAWHPATENTVHVAGERNRALAVREFQLKGGGFVISELLSFNEQPRWFTYRILKTNLPLSNYWGQMWVEPGKSGGSVVHWQAHFQRPTNGGEDAATMGLVQTVFKAGLDNLAAINK